MTLSVIIVKRLLTPHSVPPNLEFFVDDGKAVWTFKQKFDYVHGRQLHCAIEERRLFEQAYEYSI